MPAPMRRARYSVLPDPAPASTSRFRSSAVTIRSRALRSRSGRSSAAAALPLDMAPELPVGGEGTVGGHGELSLGALERRRPARAPVLAEAAIVLRGRVEEGALADERDQITQHRTELRRGARRSQHPLAAALDG